MTKHDKFEEQLSAYIDGALNAQEKSELEAHLKDCATCRSALELYKMIGETERASLVEPPADFAAGVMAKLGSLEIKEITEASKPKRKPVWPMVASFAAAAACLALVLLIQPQLFGLGGAGTAPNAALTLSSAEQDDGSVLVDSDPKYYEEMAGSPSDMAANSSVDMIPEPSLDSPSASTAARYIPDAALLESYAMLVYIDGDLPPKLEQGTMTETDDGTRLIEITNEQADALIAEGYKALDGNAQAPLSVVANRP